MTYNASDPLVYERIRGDMQEIREIADYIKAATIQAENLLLSSKIDSYEWERQMGKIHTARKRIRWIICDKRGRFDENKWLVLL
jgi:hypothetical protein